VAAQAPPVAQPPSPVPAAASAPAPVQDPADGWRRVLESLTPKTRAYFKEASARLDGDCLVLLFPYSFHHKQATESVGQVEPLVRSWLGEGVRMELRLNDAAPRQAQQHAAPGRTLAPEEDPVIKAAERKLEAKVVRVRPLKEAP
jgi:hypothetical protein